jgi:MacB-like periplasmic core domain/FtsX-like permease family
VLRERRRRFVVSSALRVGWYRFRATFGRRWGGLLAIVLLIGLIGGLAMGAVAGARRTQSSFPALLRSTHPSDLLVLHNDSADDSNQSDPGFLRTLAALPQVKRVESTTDPSELVLGADGAPAQDAAHRLFDSSAQVLADVNGEFYDQDRPVVIQGRLANADRADEMVMSADAARLLHLRVGDVVHFGFYTNAQTLEDGYGTGAQTPRLRVGVKLVGIVKFSFEIVRDDFDRGLRFVLLTPALTRPLEQCCANGVQSGVQLVRGSRDDAAVEAAVKQKLANSSVVKITATEEATTERATAPLSLALGVFGAIAALAALLIAGQAIGRHLRPGADDIGALRALGASPAMAVADGWIGAVGAVVLGAVLATIVAVALSPLSPLGPVRRVYPHAGIAFDWPVLGAGVLILLVVLCAAAIGLAYRQNPHRAGRRSARITRRRSRTSTVAAASGLAVSAVAGIRFALDPGRDRRSVPVRSAILGAVLAIVVVVATVIFGSSLNTLVSHPPLYGWNWNYEMLGNYGGLADIPLPETGHLLDRDHFVAAWSRASFDDLRIDGQAVPVLGTTPNAAVAPPVLSGRALDAPNHVVLGPTTLARLHKQLGDTVTLDNGVTKPAQLLIVGTATLPAIGAGQTLHLEIAEGAVVSEQLIPASDRGFGDLPDSPEAVLVRFHAGVDPAAARRSLDGIARNVGNIKGHGPPTLLAVQRPAEIVNYRTIGNTPSLLGAALATSAVIALGVTLLTTVRRRRRDLALLKTLGFTPRQLAAVVAWQASVAVAVGVIVGVPLGIVAGRELWNRFAHALHVVPQPTVPTVTIALVAIGALILANLVAAIPGRQAAHTPTAELLHGE